MPHLLIRHRVDDYDTWKPRFDEQVWSRRSFGASGCRIFVNADDPHEVIILFDWDDHARARLFVQSDDLRDALVRDAHIDPADVWFLDGLDEMPG
jgi:hypothetical protein